MSDTVATLYINLRFVTERIAIATVYCNEIFAGARFNILSGTSYSDEADYEKKAS